MVDKMGHSSFRGLRRWAVLLVLATATAVAGKATPPPGAEKGEAKADMSPGKASAPIVVLPTSIRTPPKSPDELARPLPPVRDGYVHNPNRRIRLLLGRSLSLSVLASHRDRWRKLDESQRRLMIRRWHGFLQTADEKKVKTLLSQKQRFDRMSPARQEQIRHRYRIFQTRLTDDERQRLRNLDVKKLVRSLTSEQRRKLLRLPPADQYRQLLDYHLQRQNGDVHPQRIR